MNEIDYLSTIWVNHYMRRVFLLRLAVIAAFIATLVYGFGIIAVPVLMLGAAAANIALDLIGRAVLKWGSSRMQEWVILYGPYRSHKLEYAAERGYTSTVEALLQGVNPDQRQTLLMQLNGYNEYEDTALALAVRNGHALTVEALLRGLSPDRRETVLRFAQRYELLTPDRRYALLVQAVGRDHHMRVEVLLRDLSDPALI